MYQPDDERPSLLFRILTACDRLSEFCGRCARILLWPLALLLAAVFQLFGRLSEWAHGVGQGFRPSDDIEPPPTWDEPHDELVRGSAAQTLDRWATTGLIGATRWLLAPVAASYHFAAALYGSRSRRLVWLSLPIVAAVGGIAIVAYLFWSQGQAQIAQRYQEAIDTALDDRQFERADLYKEKLRQMGLSVDQFDLRRADQLLADGDVAAAFAVVQRLAPEDQLGEPAAHYWLATHLLNWNADHSEKLPLEQDERYRQAIAHLDRLDEAKIVAPQLTILRATAQAGLGNLQAARQALLPAGDSDAAAAAFRLRLSLAKQDRGTLASDAAAMSRAARFSRNGRDRWTEATWESWFLAELLQNDISGAKEAAAQWSQTLPESTQARQSHLSMRVLSWQQRLQSAATIDFDQSVSELNDIMTSSETAPAAVLNTIAQAAASASAGNERAARLIAAIEASKSTGGEICWTVGTVHAAAGRFEPAVAWLQRAVEESPDLAIAWNNLAFAYAQSSPPAAQVALTAVDRAIELDPQNPQFYDTRADIFELLDRRDEAITDLEKAVALSQNAEKYRNRLTALQSSH